MGGRHDGQGTSEWWSVNSSRKHTALGAKKSAGPSNGFGTAVFHTLKLVDNRRVLHSNNHVGGDEMPARIVANNIMPLRRRDQYEATVHEVLKKESNEYFVYLIEIADRAELELRILGPEGSEWFQVFSGLEGRPTNVKRALNDYLCFPALQTDFTTSHK